MGVRVHCEESSELLVTRGKRRVTSSKADDMHDCMAFRDLCGSRLCQGYWVGVVGTSSRGSSTRKSDENRRAGVDGRSASTDAAVLSAPRNPDDVDVGCCSSTNRSKAPRGTRTRSAWRSGSVCARGNCVILTYGRTPQELRVSDSGRGGIQHLAAARESLHGRGAVSLGRTVWREGRDAPST